MPYIRHLDDSQSQPNSPSTLHAFCCLSNHQAAMPQKNVAVGLQAYAGALKASVQTPSWPNYRRKRASHEALPYWTGLDWIHPRFRSPFPHCTSHPDNMEPIQKPTQSSYYVDDMNQTYGTPPRLKSKRCRETLGIFPRESFRHPVPVAVLTHELVL
ncbi:hypothetical protein PV04_04068 [Phialophora macrospora]|uniref:Uncharacterized protein n=1 Tax=Phialophora macrospora TaxID=1851006 RepID=A0A0D2FNC8_9EURO|nr:hypothetical protein PV04_04068 [Phialophora macrospora]